MEYIKNGELCFFDTHAHYYDDRFYGEENPEGAEALLEQLFENGLLGVINVGTNANTNKLAIKQAQRFENMYAAVVAGIALMSVCVAAGAGSSGILITVSIGFAAAAYDYYLNTKKTDASANKGGAAKWW